MNGCRWKSTPRWLVYAGAATLCCSSLLPYTESDKIRIPAEVVLLVVSGSYNWPERLLLLTVWPPLLLALTVLVLYGLAALSALVEKAAAATRIMSGLVVMGMFAAVWYQGWLALTWEYRYGSNPIQHPLPWAVLVWSALPIGLASAAVVAAGSLRSVVASGARAGIIACVIGMANLAIECWPNVQFGYWVSVAGLVLLAVGTFAGAPSTPLAPADNFRGGA